VLEGSVDKDEWTTLKTHANDQSIPNQHYGTFSWPISNRGDAEGGLFRYLRVRSTGTDSSNSTSNNKFVMVGGFEVYGKLHEKSE
jgi:hypothetical protein